MYRRPVDQVTQETTGQNGGAADLLEQRIRLAEATCELIAANLESPGGPTHSQILKAWQRWRDVAAPVSEWRPERPAAPVGERGQELLQRLELAYLQLREPVLGTEYNSFQHESRRRQFRRLDGRCDESSQYPGGGKNQFLNDV